MRHRLWLRLRSGCRSFHANRLGRCGEIGRRFSGFGLGRWIKIVSYRRDDPFTRLGAIALASFAIAPTATATTATAAARAALAIRPLFGTSFAVRFILLVVAFVGITGFDGFILRDNPSGLAPFASLRTLAGLPATTAAAAAALAERSFFAF